MNKINSEYIQEKFKKKLYKENFKFFDGENIINSDSKLLFNIAGITQIKTLFDNSDTKNDNLFSIQKCIRVNDIEEIGDETHLTSFSMLGFFGFDKLTIEQGIDLLIDFFLIFFKKEELYININENDNLALTAWRKHNIEINLVKNKENMWFSGTEGPCGIGSEIFHKEKNVELANIVSINSDLKNHEIKQRNNSFVDMGAGLERIEMIINKLNNVFEIDEFVKIAELLNITNQTKTERICLDHFRTIELMEKQIGISHKKQGYIFKKLIRRFLLNFPHKINNISKNIKFRNLLINENDKLTIVLKNAEKYCLKKTTLNIKDIKFLRETIGCPKEYIYKHFADKMI